MGNIQQYLQGINLPANKAEVASGHRAAALHKISSARDIRDAATEHFNSPEEVLQAVHGSSY